MKNNRKRNLSLIIQERALKNAFPNAETTRNREEYLKCTISLTPKSFIQLFKVKIEIKKGKLEVFVLQPQNLPLYPGETSLPHVYSTSKQRLCLYFPDGTEWHGGILLTDSVVPWISEWVFFYQLWLVTGDWLGGGIKHGPKNELE